MSPIALEKEDHERDAAFGKALHGKTSQAEGGVRSMLGKDRAAQSEAVSEYFKHFDGKTAADDTPEARKKRVDEYATLTKQYVSSNKQRYELLD